MSHTRMTILAFLPLELSPLLAFDLISCLLCNSNTLWIILILLGRNVEQEEMMCPVPD